MSQAKHPRLVETAFGQYELLKPIGEGGAGRVWHAKDSSGCEVAVKILVAERLNSERRKRFKNEILFCLRHQHSNLISVLDHGTVGIGASLVPFYVMPLLQGSLRDCFARITDFDRRLAYFGQILSGVEAAHLQGVTHRDLKPENVLYDPSRDAVVVADFGIAHFQDEELYTAVETASASKLANFQYAAPEQRIRGGITDTRTDIYALGLMLNELVTATIPHGVGFRTISSVAPAFAWVDEIVHEMIQHEANKRPPSIDVVKRQLISGKVDVAERQRLSDITHTVMPVGEEDDRLALEPLRIVEFAFENGRLTLFLSRPVNPHWVQALREGSHTSLWNKGPEVFTFSGDRAIVPARESEIQQIINYFSQWLPPTTTAYRRNRELSRRRAAEAETEKLRLEREEIERQRRLRATIRL